jgi:HD-GYP domain-containing protein (c-di-GMP phosphodiesterase class II)
LSAATTIVILPREREGRSSAVRDAVRDAAREAGLIPAERPSPSEAEPLFVVDLTADADEAHAVRPTRHAIAITADGHADPGWWEAMRPEDIPTRLPRALRNLVETELLRRRVALERSNVAALNEIGQALAAVTDRDTLLAELLVRGRRLLLADGGSVYLVDGDALVFAAAQNDTIRIDFNESRLPIDEHSIAGWVAQSRQVLNIADVGGVPHDVPYQFNRSFDARTGYETRSMLAVPMLDRDAEVLGVLCFFNHKNELGALTSFDDVQPFSEDDASIARSIAAQAAVAIENHRLYADIRHLFRGFVEAAVTAVESRDPSTGGHSYRVAQLTTLLARAVSDCEDTPFATARFTEADVRELEFAAMLHDFGKIGVREEVLLKASRLFPWEMQEVELRFRLAALQAVLEAVRANEVSPLLVEAVQLLDADLEVVRGLNTPGGGRDATDLATLDAIANRWRLRIPAETVLRPRDVQRLCIPRGTLDPDERREIEQHVEHTWRFLRAIPWTRELRRVPDLAYCHHEKLDGSGYPRRLAANAIPLGSQLMAVADIYDALTASDRPYKEAMSSDAAYRILRAEAEQGKILGPAVELMYARGLHTHVTRQPSRGTTSSRHSRA